MFARISVTALLALPLLVSAGVISVVLPRDDIVGRQVTVSPVLPTLPRDNGAVIMGRQVVTISPVFPREKPDDGAVISGRQAAPAPPAAVAPPAAPAPPALPAPPAFPAPPAVPAVPVLGALLHSLLPLLFRDESSAVAGRQVVTISPTLPRRQ
ncbi:hypothetical protein F5146DRAFT_1142573 [Armillaria mellea]|nr:hypothetical protein F5146DRAFT_1142573 [Armillaria mellea]